MRFGCVAAQHGNLPVREQNFPEMSTRSRKILSRAEIVGTQTDTLLNVEFSILYASYVMRLMPSIILL
jgi:hypothetical protein